MSGSHAVRALRVGVLVALAAAAGGLAPSSGARAASPDDVMAGINVIRGSATARMSVYVPARASFDPSVDITIQGDGRVVGAVLTGAGGSYYALHINGCATPACKPDHNGPYWEFGTNLSYSGDPLPVPPGVYTLFLIADGAPVVVTWALHDPRYQHYADDLSTVLTPQSSAAATVGPLTPMPASASIPGFSTFSGTAAYDLGVGGGLVVDVLEMPDAALYALSYCLYATSTPEPACQSADPSSTKTNDGGSALALAGIRSYPFAGVYLLGLGGNFNQAAKRGTVEASVTAVGGLGTSPPATYHLAIPFIAGGGHDVHADAGAHAQHAVTGSGATAVPWRRADVAPGCRRCR